MANIKQVHFMIYLCIQWFAVSQIVWMIQMIKVQLNYVKLLVKYKPLPFTSELFAEQQKPVHSDRDDQSN